MTLILICSGAQRVGATEGQGRESILIFRFQGMSLAVSALARATLAGPSSSSTLAAASSRPTTRKSEWCRGELDPVALGNFHPYISGILHPFFANIPVLFGSIQFGVFQTWTSTISLFQQARTPRSSKFHQRRHWRRWRCFFKYIDINYLIFLLIQGETLLFKAESHFQIFPWHRNCSLI